ncbi:hypothetical protein [uncultured Microbacterium sp.]|uniref:hypothetical protein n=1 Tax=uncultured Microbacterium sp. TaxID=191216 RepID=UPI00260A0931|nr:hypothetical protein [uncultured Microbacterium sp.]
MRTVMTVDDATFSLAPGQDIVELEDSIEAAVHDGGRFVRFVVVGERDVSVMFTPHTRVVSWTEENGDATLDEQAPSIDWDGV